MKKLFYLLLLVSPQTFAQFKISNNGNVTIGTTVDNTSAVTVNAKTRSSYSRTGMHILNNGINLYRTINLCPDYDFLLPLGTNFTFDKGCINYK